MWWIFLLLTLGVSADEREDFLNDYKNDLFEAGASVIRMSKPPEFNMPPDFMRSFVPNTGVGNREELIIKNVREIPVFYDANFTQWHYSRFNNTDYLLGSSSRLVVLNKMESDAENYFVFSKDDAIFSFVPDEKSVVMESLVFTRLLKRSAALYVAILIERAGSNLIYVYEIVNDRGLMVGLITLDLSSNLPYATKISYVQSQYEGSLVVLINTYDVAEITYKQQGSTEVLHYIEVRYPAAVDMITFTIHSHGYIAVSNSSTCEIFKMDQFARNHLFFDRLHSPYGDLLDLEYFRLGFHHYLTLAGRTHQYLYAWKSGEYTLKQSFESLSTRQIFSSTLPSCRDDVILFFIGDESIGIYVYSGQNDMFTKFEIALPVEFNINPGSVTSFTHQNKAALFFLSKDWNIRSFILETSLNLIPNPILVEGKEISKYMEDIQDMLREQTQQVEYIKEVLQNAVRKSGTQTITAFQSFQELHSSEGTVVDSINNTVFVEWDGSDLTLDQYRKGTDWLEKNVIELEKLVEEIEKVIPDVVRVDEVVEITGTKHFVGDIKGSSISSFSVDLESIADLNLPQLQKEIYRLDKPQKIDGTLVFEKPLTVTGNLNVETTINGIDISKDIMTTDTDQISFAHMTFTNKLEIQNDLEVSGTLNGIKVRDEIVTLSGTHLIRGQKSFQGGLIAENVTTQVIDGVVINDLYQNALTKSSTQEIPGTKIFSGGLLTKNILLDGRLNGYDIAKLAENIVRTDKPAIITGHKDFLEDVTINSDLTVEGKVNNLLIPDDLFLTDVSQEVTGLKEFTGTVFAKDVEVTGKVDGLSIPDDIVTLSKDEEIPSTLYFTDGIDVKGDIIVEGLVDGVDISEVAKEALKLNESSKFENAIFLGPVTIKGDLQVKGLINNVNLDELVNDIVYKDEEDIVIESEKKIQKVIADHVILHGMINGYNMDVDFMKVHGDQLINGTKHFKQSVTFDSLDVENGLIGDLNITQLYENRLSIIVEEDIERDIEFTNEVIVEGNLVVQGTIGGLRIPDDVVLKDSNHPISNKVFTDLIKVDNLIVNGDALVSGSFNGVNLTQFNQDRIKLKGHQEIEGDFFVGASEIESLEIDGPVNGVDIVDFANNVMSKTKPQIVRAKKEFLGPVTVHGKITTEEGVNGFDLQNLNSRAFKLYEDNVLKGHFEFKDISVNDVNVAGLINGVNLTWLSQNSLKKKGLQYVTGKTVLEKGFHVDGDINADSINDLSIVNDILLKSIPQTITGQYTLGKLEVNGDIDVTGLVNGLDLSEVAPKLARIDETILISNVTFIGPIRVMQDISVTGLVNGIDMKHLSDNVLLKSGYQKIKGNKVLKGNVTIMGDIDVDFVNGADWKQFLSDVVRTNEPQTVTAPKIFLGDAEADTVYATLATVDLINGKSLQKLVDDAVFIDVPANITGPKVFKMPIEISGNMTAGLINGLRLNTDVITLMCSPGKPQVITGRKTFTKLTADSDVMVGGTVNSYNLLDLYKDTLLTEGDQTVKGHKKLTKEVKFMKNVYPGTVNNMKLKDHLVTLNTDQDIEGSIVFTNNVYIEKNLIVDGLIDGVNLTQLALEAVYLDRDQAIDGSFYFYEAASTSDVKVTGTVNGLDLITFDRNVSDFWIDASQSLAAIEKHSKDNCEILQYLQATLSKSFYTLNGFILYQDLKHPASYIHIKSPTELALVSLDILGSTALAVSSVWEPQSRRFVSPGEAFQTSVSRIIILSVGITKISIHIGIFEKDSKVLVNGEVSELPVGFKEASYVVRKKNEVIIGFLFPSKGKCELYWLASLENSDIEFKTYGTVTVGKEATSIAIFDVKNTLYLAVSRHYDPPYYRGFCKIFGQQQDGWQRIQSISVAASTSVKHFMYHNYHYLAFTNIAPVHETREPKSLQIYRNSGPDELFFTLFQKVPFENAKGLDIFEFGDLSELYIVTWNETVVQIFRLEGESGLKEAFILHGKCIKNVKALLVDNDVYLAVGQQNLDTEETVTSVLYKGLIKGSKFVPHNFIYC